MATNRIQIHEKYHLDHPWKAHSLLPDFELEDVWRVPVVLKEEHSLSMFMDQFRKSNTQIIQAGSVVGLLFKLRFFLGRIFQWDEKPETNHLVPGSIRERYALSENLSFENLPDPGKGDFIPVYILENEFLSEIENKTVHAALHLGRVRSDKEYSIQMAVYVKPKGRFGKIYMQLIRPFRHWIVYPALMKLVSTSWERFLSEQQAPLKPILN